MIITIAPGLFSGTRFLGQKLLLALVGISFVFLRLCTSELQAKVEMIIGLLTVLFYCLRSAMSDSNSKTYSWTAVAIYDFITISNKICQLCKFESHGVLGFWGFGVLVSTKSWY